MWTFWHNSLLSLVLFCLACSAGKNSILIGSSEPIVGLVGYDAVLPCKVDPPQAIWENDLVEWIRVDQEVHEFVYEIPKNNKVVNPDFSHRFYVFRNQMKNGTVSLKLYSLKRSDAGTYECHLPKLRSLKEATGCRVHLKVGAVSKPEIHVVGQATGEALDLQCEAEGWYPEPKMEWRVAEEYHGSMSPQKVKPSQDGFYTVTRNITINRTQKTGWIVCQVLLEALNLTRQDSFEVHPFFFNTLSNSDLWSYIFFAVLSTLVVAAVFIAALIKCMKRRWVKYYCPLCYQQIHGDHTERTRQGNFDSLV